MPLLPTKPEKQDKIKEKSSKTIQYSYIINVRLEHIEDIVIRIELLLDFLRSDCEFGKSIHERNEDRLDINFRFQLCCHNFENLMQRQ